MQLTYDFLAQIHANGEIRKEEFPSDNIIACEVGTNGHMYNNSGRGTYTYISLKDLAGTNWDLVTERGEWGDLKGFKIMLEGDSELDSIADVFQWCADNLRQMAHKLYQERKEGKRKIISLDEYYGGILFGKEGNPIKQIDDIIKKATAKE